MTHFSTSIKTFPGFQPDKLDKFISWHDLKGNAKKKVVHLRDVFWTLDMAMDSSVFCSHVLFFHFPLSYVGNGHWTPSLDFSIGEKMLQSVEGLKV